MVTSVRLYEVYRITVPADNQGFASSRDDRWSLEREKMDVADLMTRFLIRIFLWFLIFRPLFYFAQAMILL